MLTENTPNTQTVEVDGHQDLTSTIEEEIICPFCLEDIMNDAELSTEEQQDAISDIYVVFHKNSLQCNSCDRLISRRFKITIELLEEN